MQTYKFNTQTLQWDQVPKTKKFWNLLIAAAIFAAVGFTSGVKVNTIVDKIPVIIRSNEVKFSPENLKKEIARLNIKFGDIVYKQAVLETGGFTSNIFKNNNNLFGMKKPALRPTTVVGEQFNHAVFNTWQESVIDMAIWNGVYCKDIKTEEEYYTLLQAIYAEDPSYVSRLKALR